MNKYIRWGIIGVVTILAIFGGYIVLSDDEIENAYYCTANSKVGIFESLSSTNKTGYWYEDNVRKQSTCVKGEWIYLKVYCDSNGIKNCKQVSITKIQEDVRTGRYWCTDTCDEILN